MNKKVRYSTQEHVSIVFEIFNLIPYSHKTTAQAIQQQLHEKDIERDIRTIQRNLEILVKLNLISKDDRSKPYGYQILNKKFSTIEIKEALILQLAQNHICSLLPQNVINALNGRFEDARIKLASSSEKTKEKQWLKKVATEYSNDPVMKQTKEIIAKISTALYHNNWITFDLKETPNKPIHLMPLGLIQRTHGITLVATNEEPDRLCTQSFELVDINSVEISTFTFNYPKDFNLKHYLSNPTQPIRNNL